jgi:putative acetyltransferase
MHIRLANAEDDAALLTLFHDSIYALAPEHYQPEELQAWAPKGQAPDWVKWRRRLEPLVTLAAWEGDVLLGFLSYEIDGHIDFLYTSPHAVRRGVATTLLRQAEEEIQRRGVQTFFTEASRVAKPFFAHHGYRVEAEEWVERSGVCLRRFRMRKP